MSLIDLRTGLPGRRLTGWVLEELVKRGASLILDDDSRVVENLALAVKVDRITLQFELLIDDIKQAELFLKTGQRSRRWLTQLLRDLEEVMDIFSCLYSKYPFHAK